MVVFAQNYGNNDPLHENLNTTIKNTPTNFDTFNIQIKWVQYLRQIMHQNSENTYFHEE